MVTAIGVIVGVIVTIVVSRYYFLRSMNKSLGVYGLLNSLVFAGIARDVRAQLAFYFEGREINELQEIIFLVANDGERAIRDVIEPLTLSIPPSIEVLDASILDRHPAELRANVVVTAHPSDGTDIRCDFPLLNKRDFFIVKLLLSGRFKLSEAVFHLLADDLPRNVRIKQLPPSATARPSYGFAWGAAIFSLIPFVIAAWMSYAAILLYRAYPSLSPQPWSSFMFSWRSLFILVVGAFSVLSFVILGFLALAAAMFGGEFPPPRPRFPLSKDVRNSVFPYRPYLRVPEFDDVPMDDNTIKPDQKS